MLIMGTFAKHPLGNDAALDLIDLWERLIKGRLGLWRKSPTKALRRLVENGFSEPLYTGESYRNEQLIALAELFLRSQLVVPVKLKKAVEKAMGDELYEQVLLEWKSPEQRKARLRELCDHLKIAPKPRKPKRESVVEFDSADALLERMKSWAGDKKKWAAEYPRFCQTLDSLMESQLGFDYDDSYNDATQQRLMMMTFYITQKLRLEPEQSIELVKRAYQFIWPGLFGAEWHAVSRPQPP